jgi:hypothetical protein
VNLTKASIIAISIAMLLWSISIVRVERNAMLAVPTGVLAVLAQFFILIYGRAIITAHTIVFLVAAQRIWYFIIGVLLTKGQL